MMSTVSFKDKLKQMMSMLKWEIKTCSGTLTVYAILASVFLAVLLTLCIVIGSPIVADFNGDASNSFAKSVEVFQIVGVGFIEFLTIVFSIIYTVKVFSYLHNKRQTDLYGALPISRTTLYISKMSSAILFSIIPAFVFYLIITLISVCCSVEIADVIPKAFLNTLILAFTCVTSYGVIAVCCGTTMNSIIMYLTISIAYPLSVFFATGIAGGMFIGSDFSVLVQSFVTTALTPMAARSQNHPIYWCIFTVVCIAAGALLARYRKSERAQSSFAYYIPCHIVKLLVSFLCGAFLGTLFGSLNVLNNGYLGFVFGFVLASVPAFVIAHLIFYKGFSKLIKTAIPLGAMVVIVLAGVGIANIDGFGYNSYVPKPEDVKSAGYIDTYYHFTTQKKHIREIAKEACDDYTDVEGIKKVCNAHSALIKNLNINSAVKFQYAWVSMATNLLDMPDDDTSVFSYKMNNGLTVTRYYNNSFLNSASEEPQGDNVANIKELDDIIASKDYQQKYSAMLNMDIKDVANLSMDISGNGTNSEYPNVKSFYEDKEEHAAIAVNSDSKAMNDIMLAYRKDFEADTKDIDTALYGFRDEFISYTEKYYNDYWNICKDKFSDDAACIIYLNSFVEFNDENNQDNFFGGKNQDEYFVVPKSYTNTIRVLKELEVIDDDFIVADGYEYEYYYDTEGIY